VFAGFSLVTAVLVVTIFNQTFPACYIEGVGLTPFKIVSEYVISAILLGAMALLLKNRQEFDPVVLRYLIAALAASIVSEIAFTNYVSVYGAANLLGHLFKILKDYFLFLAIIDTGFHRPFSLLLRSLKQNEKALRSAHDQLEQRIEERTQELAISNAQLRAEIAERQRVEASLRESEARFRTIFEESPIGVEVVGLDGKILASNAALQHMLGYGETELNQLHFIDITDPADRSISEVLFHDLVTGTRDSYRFEKRYMDRDGKSIWTQLTISLVRDDRDQPVFAIGMIENLTERERIETELREVQRRLMDSKEAERLSLARELHDGPIQDLLAAIIHLQQLRMDLTGERTSEAAFVQDLVAQVSNTLRTICGELRPQALAPFGLEKAIRSHAEDFREKHPELELELDLAPDGKTLPESTRMALYRIYQQSLNNVVRHSKASRVYVRFDPLGETILLEVRDNGQGFAVPEGWIQLVREGHLGLAGMSERAEAIRGKMSVYSIPGEGTRIQVTVPRNGHQDALESIPAGFSQSS